MERFSLEMVEELKSQQAYSQLYQYCKKYAKKNHEALAQLATCYFNGWGVEQDFKMSALFDYQAAKQGNLDAMAHLAMDYASGQGFAQDDIKAYRLYKAAARQGHIESQFQLALCYYHGKGTRQNLEKAQQWLEEAAILGYDKAQCSLGFSLMEGLCGITDKTRAYYWLHKAADQGNELAAKYVARNIKEERIHDILLELNQMTNQLDRAIEENIDTNTASEIEALMDKLSKIVSRKEVK